MRRASARASGMKVGSWFDSLPGNQRTVRSVAMMIVEWSAFHAHVRPRFSKVARRIRADVRVDESQILQVRGKKLR